MTGLLIDMLVGLVRKIWSTVVSGQKKEKSIFLNDNMTQLIQLPRQRGFPEFSSLPIFQLPSCCLVLCLLGQNLFFHLEINFEDSIQSSELHYGIFTI